MTLAAGVNGDDLQERDVTASDTGDSFMEHTPPPTPPTTQPQHSRALNPRPQPLTQHFKGRAAEKRGGHGPQETQQV